MTLGATLPLLASVASADSGLLTSLDATAGAPVESRALALAMAIGQMTGLALSPVLVLGLFGLWDWLRLDSGAPLPLHAQPWLWAPLLTISILAALGRSGLLTVPGGKYLIDVPQQINSKLTALVAAGILLPTISASLHAAGIGVDDSEFARAGLGGDVVLWLVGLTAFFSVWVVSNTVDALRFLCPFAAIDFTLTLARAALLTVVLAALSIDGLLGFPLLTPIVCVPLIVACALVAGPCVRLNLFATVCAWDMLTQRWRRTDATSGPLRAFVARRRVGAPVRTIGWLEPGTDRIRFSWRPLFVLPPRSIELPTARPVLTRGVVWSVVSSDLEGQPTACFAFPPRYRGHEPTVAARLDATLADGMVLRGIKGTVRFVRAMFGMPERAVPAPA